MGHFEDEPFMYTQCPSCSTLFRVRTRYLQEASGRVRCCLCHETFDARASLTDRLPEGAPQAVQTAAADAAVEAAAPAADLALAADARVAPDEDEHREPELEPAAAVASVAVAPQPVADDFEAAEPGEDFDIDAGDAPVDVEPPARRGAGAEAAEAERDLFLDIHFDPLPELENEPVVAARRSGGIAVLAWTAATLLLIVVLLLQYIYFARDELAQEPRLRPWLEAMCGVTGCELPLRKDLAQVQILQRRVAAHPSAPGALLVRATISNEASFAQPYPELRLSFLDANGREQGSRWFTPQEYLEDPQQRPQIEAGMPSKQPIAVRLELLDPGRAAENFEISFR